MTSTSTSTTTTELRSRIEDQRNAIGQDLDALGDRLSPRRMAERRTAAVRERVTSVRERIMGSAIDAREATAHAAADAAGKVADAPQIARRQVEGNPLGAGLLALAAGLVVATLLPESPPEQTAVGRLEPALERVAGEVGQVAQDSAERLRPEVEDSVGTVRDQARDSAAHVGDDARDALSEVRTQTGGAGGSAG